MYQHITTKELKEYRDIKSLDTTISYPVNGTEMLGEDWRLVVTTTKPIYDVYTEGINEIAPINYIQTWEVYTLSATELDDNLTNGKQKKMIEFGNAINAESRPIVQVPLEDTSTLSIFGSREDQFDIGDRYNLMQEDNVPIIYMRDAFGVVEYLGHLDIKRCYKAITIHRQNVIEYQWTKESEIMACTTSAEVDLIIWNIP